MSSTLSEYGSPVRSRLRTPASPTCGIRSTKRRIIFQAGGLFNVSEIVRLGMPSISSPALTSSRRWAIRRFSGLRVVEGHSSPISRVKVRTRVAMGNPVGADTPGHKGCSRLPIGKYFDRSCPGSEPGRASRPRSQRRWSPAPRAAYERPTGATASPQLHLIAENPGASARTRTARSLECGSTRGASKPPAGASRQSGAEALTT